MIEASVALTDEMLTITPLKLGVGLPLVDHPAGGELREKVRPFEIDRRSARSKLSSVASRMSARTFGRDAGVVHEHIEPAEPLPHGVDDRLPIGRLRDVALAIVDRRAALLERGDRIGHLRRVADAVDRQVEAAVGQRTRRSRGQSRGCRRSPMPLVSTAWPLTRLPTIHDYLTTKARRTQSEIQMSSSSCAFCVCRGFVLIVQSVGPKNV